MMDTFGAGVGETAGLEPERLHEFFVHVLRVRCVDERMLKLQRSGRIGFVGSSYGLEGAMIGAAMPLKRTDWLWSGLREGGAAVARGLPLSEYIAQMYCNANDTARGRQMCNHFQHKGTNYPSWSSVIGTQIPHGVGAAYASKLKGKDEVHAIFFGDGASSSNGFHSGVNFASVWEVPCVFVLVNNGWAISVPASAQTAAPYVKKAKAYGIPGIELDGNDILQTYEGMGSAVEAARRGEGPSLVVVNTYRMHGHSSSDDPSKYRDDAEVAAWADKDPIDRFEAKLIGLGVLKPDSREQLRADLFKEIDAVVNEQEAAPKMPLKSLVEDVYAEVPHHLRVQYNDFIRIAERLGDAQRGDGAFPL